jgi:(p)ppGpp synthase/HD superfamily hydrolase
MNRNYFYLCKAIKKGNEYAATHFFHEIRNALETRPKHLYWFYSFMQKYNCYIETIFDRLFKRS